MERAQVLKARADTANAQRDYAAFRSTQAEAGRLAERAARAQEATWRTAFEKEARDGQARIDLARADADRAGAALDGLRRQLSAVLAAERGTAGGAQPAAAGPAAGSALDLLADMLSGGGTALVDLARFADAAHAAGLTCQRSVEALR
ncbi:hypothetical protein NS331_16610 [Pseudacidovorax intermedius]|uniref:Uncharacterized protein n=1 Tax=Pseudacidovorax intermedius TaxID=433924 RepID=A0A147GQH8_9BURK|nr:hypothetical protein NS331_16610 [Pseudacidovorax intermedius]